MLGKSNRKTFLTGYKTIDDQDVFADFVFSVRKTATIIHRNPEIEYA
jgi:hypothetical protein